MRVERFGVCEFRIQGTKCSEVQGLGVRQRGYLGPLNGSSVSQIRGLGVSGLKVRSLRIGIATMDIFATYSFAVEPPSICL